MAFDDMEEMAQRGRAQLRAAQSVGRLAVDFGRRQVKQQALGKAGQAEAVARAEEVGVTPAEAMVSPAETYRRDPEVDRAIPDYDTLSASQVVRRLDSLDTLELGAVLRHELATRARLTIVRRTEQLIGRRA